MNKKIIFAKIKNQEEQNLHYKNNNKITNKKKSRNLMGIKSQTKPWY